MMATSGTYSYSVNLAAIVRIEELLNVAHFSYLASFYSIHRKA